jgi:hypothetical protein
MNENWINLVKTQIQTRLTQANQNKTKYKQDFQTNSFIQTILKISKFFNNIKKKEQRKEMMLIWYLIIRII